jgi:hypothetical protein
MNEYIRKKQILVNIVLMMASEAETSRQYIGADKSLALAGMKQATSMSKSS